MKKAELIANIASNADLSKADADRAVSAVIDEITSCLSGGGSLTLVGFGTFSTYARSARKGRNPQTGAEITIPASTGVRFKPAKVLKDAVN